MIKKKVYNKLYSWITMPLVTLDGIFHAFGPGPVIHVFAPDWVIRRGIDDAIGMPLWFHRIIGAFILSVTAYIIYLKTTKKKLTSSEEFFIRLYDRGVVPITLLMVATGLLLKFVFGV